MIELHGLLPIKRSQRFARNSELFSSEPFLQIDFFNTEDVTFYHGVSFVFGVAVIYLVINFFPLVRFFQRNGVKIDFQISNYFFRRDF
jgi:hypothetical protein